MSLLKNELQQEIIILSNEKIFIQFIKETGHTVLETNDDGITNAAECKSDIHF